jgi:hypothetical protein
LTWVTVPSKLGKIWGSILVSVFIALLTILYWFGMVKDIVNFALNGNTLATIVVMIWIVSVPFFLVVISDVAIFRLKLWHQHLLKTRSR